MIVYGLTLALLVALLKSIEYKWLVRDISWQLYVLFIAVFFTLLGMWFSDRLVKRNETTVPFQPNAKAINALKLSKRELQVLQKLSEGLPNQDIADQLYVSVNTVKTHLKNGFSKLEVSNRLQAINKLKELNIIQ